MVTGLRRAWRPSSRPRTRWASRTGERGASLLVVLLVITLLMGIGLFTAESTRLAVATSGNERRMTQARYVAEYALLVMQSKLSNGLGEAYLKAMSGTYTSNGTTLDQCTGQAQANMTAPTCAKLYYNDVKAELAAVNPPFQVCDATSNGTPGSLGLANAVCDFAIELTDKTQGTIPAGTNVSTAGAMGSQTLKYWFVTASATGWVRLNDPNAANAAESSTNQLLRARILAGPYF